MRGRPGDGQEAPPLPVGFSLVLDPDTVVRSEGRVVVGGDPPRTLALSTSEARLLEELDGGPVRTAEAGALARRLVDSGAAHPRPPRSAAPGRTAVVIPVRDRAVELDRLLRSLNASEDAGMVKEVLVVDDGSQDPEAVASAAARHGARLIARPANGGPAAARNSGLAACAADVEHVAFLDSDCVPSPGWLAPLLAHLADPEVGAVAPRIRPARPDRSVLGAYAVARFPLDLGEREALVRPGGRVGYLPTAALVLRRAAVNEDFFDEGLRYGEDVDAVWRLADSGWRVRYEPQAQVVHTEPATWSAYLARRYHYGTCAGPLALRHPDRIAAIMLRPAPAVTAAVLLLACPALAGVLLGSAVCGLPRHLRRAGLSATAAAWVTAQPVGATMVGLGRALAQVGLPALPAAAVAPGRRGRRLAMMGALAAAPALRDWLATRPPVDPVRWTLASLADDAAHGVGVWHGALRSRTLAPLLPRFRSNRP